MFKDKVYEDMDDISKLIEPYQYSVNDDLSQFPDVIEVDTSFIDCRYISTRSLISLKARELGLKALIDNIYEVEKSNFFKFEMFDEFNEPTRSIKFDFNTGEIKGKILLVKNKIAFEDKDVHTICEEGAVTFLMSTTWRATDSNRMNEIADLLGIDGVLKEKSKRSKLYALTSGIRSLVREKKIDIRDAGLAKRFGRWLVLYINDGNLPALGNIAKMKIMSHQNKPIYSIQEQGVD